MPSPRGAIRLPVAPANARGRGRCPNGVKEDRIFRTIGVFLALSSVV